MDNIVVDSSIVVKWFVTEAFTPEALKLLDGYLAGNINFIAPDLLSAEFGNTIWKKVRLSRLSKEDAEQIINVFQELLITFVPTQELLKEAFRIAIAYDRTVYDALYVALSLRENCLYITADEKLVNAICESFPNIVWIAKWTIEQ